MVFSSFILDIYISYDSPFLAGAFTVVILLPHTRPKTSNRQFYESVVSRETYTATMAVLQATKQNGLFVSLSFFCSRTLGLLYSYLNLSLLGRFPHPPRLPRAADHSISSGLRFRCPAHKKARAHFGESGADPTQMGKTEVSLFLLEGICTYMPAYREIFT